MKPIKRIVTRDKGKFSVGFTKCKCRKNCSCKAILIRQGKSSIVLVTKEIETLFKFLGKRMEICMRRGRRVVRWRESSH